MLKFAGEMASDQKNHSTVVKVEQMLERMQTGKGSINDMKSDDLVIHLGGPEGEVLNKGELILFYGLLRKNLYDILIFYRCFPGTDRTCELL